MYLSALLVAALVVVQHSLSMEARAIRASSVSPGDVKVNGVDDSQGLIHF